MSYDIYLVDVYISHDILACEILNFRFYSTASPLSFCYFCILRLLPWSHYKDLRMSTDIPSTPDLMLLANPKSTSLGDLASYETIMQAT